MQEELRMLSEAKGESESKRRKQEQLIADYNSKLQETERQRNDLQDKYHKCSVSVFFIIFASSSLFSIFVD